MAELFGQGEEPESEVSPAVQTDTSAVAIALDRARRRKGKAAANDEVDRFLARQEALIDDQRAHLHEQMAHMRLKHGLDRLRYVTQAGALVVGALVLAMIGWAVVEASRADGFLIKPFSTPPELAQRGVTGEAVANELLDQLNQIGETARSNDARKQAAADGGAAVSIEIPHTGISLEQLQQWLRGQLGHQTPITGEVTVLPDGSLSLVARVADHALPVQGGAPGELAALVGKTAEAIYRREQPFTYVQFLERNGRIPETTAVAREVMLTGDRSARARAWVVEGNARRPMEGTASAMAAYWRAYEIDPKASPYVANDIAQIEGTLGHYESERRYALEALAVARTTHSQSQAARRASEMQLRQSIAMRLGDTQADLAAAQAYADTFAEGSSARLGERRTQVARALSRSHQTAAAWAERDEVGLLMRGGGRAGDAASPGEREPPQFPMDIALGAEDWTRASAACDAEWPVLDAMPDHGVLNHAVRGNCARAYALAGRLAEADKALAPTPLDCQPCVIARGVVAEVKGDHAGADRWLAQASRLAPSLPQADYIWARQSMARGQPKQALDHLAEALRRSPRDTNAIELTGEALMAQGDARGAVRRFEAANEFAPKWGRLHLKWGEALGRLGKADEAKAQLKTASGLDLTADERAELGKVKL